MKRGIRPGSENRLNLLRALREKNMSASTARNYTKEMRGKAEKEKEEIAARLLRELEAKK